MNATPSELRELADEPIYDKLGVEWEAKVRPALRAAASRIEQVRAQTIEECAKVCDDIARSEWNEYKTGHGPKRADTRIEGISDGAEMCAEAIRALAQSNAAEHEARDRQLRTLEAQGVTTPGSPASAAPDTPLTDALFAKHQAECASVDFEALGKAGINKLAVRQVRELLDHSRRLELALRQAVGVVTTRTTLPAGFQNRGNLT